MRSHLLITIVSCAVLVATPVAAAFNPNFVLSDSDLLTAGMSREQVQSFLERQTGVLDTYTLDVDGLTKRAADVIYEAAAEFALNPKFLLVLLQKEQSLIADADPTEDQLFWATGYGVCDSCKKTDPEVLAKGGFVNQLRGAAGAVRNRYLPNIESEGQYLGWGPALAKTITCIASDNGLCASGAPVTVTPENAATAAMYIYTPHLHGNYNFWRLWNSWFRNLFPDGLILHVRGDGYFLLRGGTRRKIDEGAVTSWVAGNRKLAIDVNADELAKYDAGAPLHFARRQLVQIPGGGTYLIVDDVKRPITSRAAFEREGFSRKDVIKKSVADVAIYQTGESITTESTYPAGRLLQSRETGAVYFVQDGVRRAFYSRRILKANFPDARAKKVQQAELDALVKGEPMPFPDGSLLVGESEGTVYLVSDGKKLPIANPQTMKTFGLKFSALQHVTDHELEALTIGDLLDTTGANG